MRNEQIFLKELEVLINKHSIDNEFSTPDYILSRYVVCCMKNLYSLQIEKAYHNTKCIAETLSKLNTFKCDLKDQEEKGEN